MDNLKAKLSRIYLSLVPIWVTVIALAVGYISYTIYLPVWIINVVLMIVSTWYVGLKVIRVGDSRKKQLAAGAFLLMVPMMITSMFFGLGPPPETPAKWMETVTEQQIRFIMLIISGIVAALGFAVVKESLKETGERFYSSLGWAAVLIATPLFIFNMIFWSAYLPELFKIMTTSGLDKSPEWFHPMRDNFNLLTPVVSAVMYIGLAAFAAGLKSAGWFNKKALVYIVICFAALAIAVFPYSYKLLPVPFFIVTIPAAPFTVAYFMGINLLSYLRKG